MPARLSLVRGARERRRPPGQADRARDSSSGSPAALTPAPVSPDLSFADLRGVIRRIEAKSRARPVVRRVGRLEDVLDGQVEETDGGPIFVVRRRFPAGHRHGARRARARGRDASRACICSPAPGARRRRAVGSSTSTPRRPVSPAAPGPTSFLVGLGFFDGDVFEVRQYFMRDLDEEPALLAARRPAARAVRCRRDVQRRRVRPAAPRDALRARATALARRGVPPRPPALRAACVERATRRLPPRHDRAARARLRAGRRSAGRADPGGVLRLPAAQATRERRRGSSSTTATTSSRSPRSPAGSRARWPARRCSTRTPRSWPGSAGSGSRPTWSGASPAIAWRSSVACRAPAANASASGWPPWKSAARAGTTPALCGPRPSRAPREFDPRPWEEIAKVHEHRRRDFAAALEVVEQALALARRHRASARVLAAFEHRLDRLDRRIQMGARVAFVRAPALPAQPVSGEVRRGPSRPPSTDLTDARQPA